MVEWPEAPCRAAASAHLPTGHVPEVDHQRHEQQQDRQREHHLQHGKATSTPNREGGAPLSATSCVPQGVPPRSDVGQIANLPKERQVGNLLHELATPLVAQGPPPDPRHFAAHESQRSIGSDGFDVFCVELTTDN